MTHRSANICNFAIVGHASSGKTMLSEAMLACSGTIGRMGRIADGSTVSDYHVSERQRQISTQTSLLHTTWMEKKFNIMDTPGYLDFMSEALAAFEKAADVKVEISPDTVRDLRSPGASGLFSVERALQELLAGTGIAIGP